jgi:hypothetical protein
MKWTHVWLLPLVGVLGACAADGGSRGSGISASLAGNVATVQTAALLGTPGRAAAARFAPLRAWVPGEHAARAASAIEGIRVTIEETGTTGETDANGHFLIAGRFRGHLTVLFELPASGASAHMQVSLPAGGTLTLNDVHFDAQSGLASADTQGIDCQGLVSDTDCAGLTITMTSIEASAAYPPDRYIIRLDTSTLLDAAGRALRCEALRVGEHVTVRGIVNPDGSFGQAVAQVQD